MPRLCRMRLSSIGHDSARFDDLTLDFTDRQGRPTNSVLWLRNGGGKSSLLSLFLRGRAAGEAGLPGTTGRREGPADRGLCWSPRPRGGGLRVGTGRRPRSFRRFRSPVSQRRLLRAQGGERRRQGRGGPALLRDPRLRDRTGADPGRTAPLRRACERQDPSHAERVPTPAPAAWTRSIPTTTSSSRTGTSASSRRSLPATA